MPVVVVVVSLILDSKSGCPVLEVASLPNSRRWESLLAWRDGCDCCPPTAREAQMDDRGKKMATRVTVFEAICGTLTKYCRMEKMASISLANIERRMSWGQLTRNDKSLTSHDEDDLHRPELVDSKLSASMNGKAKLGHENEAEEADADGDDDVGCALEPIGRTRVFRLHDKFRELHNDRKSEANGQESHQHRSCMDHPAVPLAKGRADNLRLKKQRDLEAYDHDEGEHHPCNRDGVLGLRNLRVVVSEVCVRI